MKIRTIMMLALVAVGLAVVLFRLLETSPSPSPVSATRKPAAMPAQEEQDIQDLRQENTALAKRKALLQNELAAGAAPAPLDPAPAGRPALPAPASAAVPAPARKKPDPPTPAEVEDILKNINWNKTAKVIRESGVERDLNISAELILKMAAFAPAILEASQKLGAPDIFHSFSHELVGKYYLPAYVMEGGMPLTDEETAALGKLADETYRARLRLDEDETPGYAFALLHANYADKARRLLGEQRLAAMPDLDYYTDIFDSKAAASPSYTFIDREQMTKEATTRGLALEEVWAEKVATAWQQSYDLDAAATPGLLALAKALGGKTAALAEGAPPDYLVSNGTLLDPQSGGPASFLSAGVMTHFRDAARQMLATVPMSDASKEKVKREALFICLYEDQKKTNGSASGNASPQAQP